MRYEIEADWILLNTCNYRCEYCFVPPELLAEKIQVSASPKQWYSAFEATDRTWLLHLTGGEPGAYPELVALAELLTRRHFISLNSNLSLPCIAEFADKIDPSRVSFVNAGLHIAERDRRLGHARFLENAHRLIDRGFPLFVSLVATPAALARMDEAIDALRPIGLLPVPKLFRGSFGNKVYPDAFTTAERTAFTKYAQAAREAYQSILARMPERPTIDIFRDDEFLYGEPTFTGQLCDAGSRLVRITPTGDVHRCGPQALGNLLAGTFKPLSGPHACDTRFCYYFCEKYTNTAKRQSKAVPLLSRVLEHLTGRREAR